MKDYKTEARGGLPEIWVYEKVSDAEYKREDIALCGQRRLPVYTGRIGHRRMAACATL